MKYTAWGLVPYTTLWNSKNPSTLTVPAMKMEYVFLGRMDNKKDDKSKLKNNSSATAVFTTTSTEFMSQSKESSNTLPVNPPYTKEKPI